MATNNLSSKLRSPGRALSAFWVPVRSLAVRHRGRIAAHLQSLDEHDRYLRFGYTATDEQITRYVQSLDFERDEVFGIFNRRLELIAMAHLAYAPQAQLEGQPAMAEFGVSVLKKARGHGYGKRLFAHAMLHARNRGIDTLFIYALSENSAMLHIAREAGAKIERDGSDSQAWLKLPPGNFGSQLDELIERQAAELNYGMKRQARHFNRFLDAVSEAKDRLPHDE
jgi:RimJ/RimL family protein N-acetyltransferase